MNQRRCLTRWIATLATLALGAGLTAPASADDRPEITANSVEMIWDKAPHNAFTDLLRYKDHLLCAFREAPKHHGGVPDSFLRLISSTDGKKWDDVVALSDPRGDIRDAKLAVLPDGRLMVLTALQLFDREQGLHQSLVWFTDDLKTWDGPHDVGEKDYWLWGISWHNGVGYSIGYNAADGYTAKLYSTRDGKQFDVLIDALETKLEPGKVNKPNEGAIAFHGDTAYCLLRAFGPAFVGTAEPPYDNWRWVRAPEPVGGPELIVLPDGKLLGAGRRYLPGKLWRTSIMWVDPETGQLDEALQLPSGGDTSYPGLVLEGDMLHMSYYSSHQGIGKSSIYFADLKLSGAPTPGGGEAKARSTGTPTTAATEYVVPARSSEVPPAESYRIELSAPQKQKAATIHAEAVIAKQPKRYAGWPSITRAGNGDLIAVFSGNRDWHVDPWGRLMMVRSTDNGKTWGQPETIIDTPLDDRDAGITTLPDGSLIAAFNTSMAYDNAKVERYVPYQAHAASISKDIRDHWNGPWTIRSTDHGKTWGEPSRSPTSTPHGPTPLADGRLLYVRPSVYESSDLGQSWNQIARIDRDPATWKSRYAFLSEQHAVETADGRIVALARYASEGNKDIELRQIESADGGYTWTQPAKTGMQGYPAHLLRLSNGWLVASYGRRVAPMGQRACISKDHGRTWLVDEEIVLSNATPQGAGDLGYPCSVELPDGSIWTVFYQVEKKSDGEFPALMGVHWSPMR